MRPRLSFLLLALALWGLAYVLWARPSPPKEAAGGEGVGLLPEMRLVVAARDIDYCGYHTPCGPGSRTDTIFYVLVQGGRVRLVAIPRDTYSEVAGGRINAAYGRGGAELLKRAVEEALGLPVEHHLVLTLTGVARLIDAVGGVEVVLDRPMRYTDRAARLYIDFPAGRLHLMGEDAVKYMRFRHDAFGDYARLDRIKEVLGQVLERAKDPRRWPALLLAAREAWQELDTDLSLEALTPLLPHLRNLSLEAATLPTFEAGVYLRVDPRARAEFLARFLGEEKPLYPPDLPLTVRGSREALERAEPFLRALGLALRLEEGTGVPGVYTKDLEAGRYYADLFHLPLLSPHVPVEGVVVVLGQDLL
ncbi:LCP family protein [Thermus filiformis]|uniref:LytR family transcriptional regulator n=1 Tax=Thermus filiformis TaxID=276 RepID=A0A0A2WQ57_THEFI|nr:LCP family protein [Thermus filiformis]KGQ20897.1 LytR family transcriptional regulator [Thermus filiformis]